MAKNDKIKPIVLTDKETSEKYVLEFSRESVKFAETRGFSGSDAARFPMTKVPELFFYAFRKNHKNVARSRTDRILFDDLEGLSNEAVERLVALYAAPFDALVRDAEDGESKNARMTVDL